ncbi:MAG: DUF3375 family protein, partial [Eggerthellaceae bacterium]|nr:DUF3375 family protein [Eggerthellaceae bacterium]
VNACIEDMLLATQDEDMQSRSWVGISDVLDRFPATQGAASIVGLVALAIGQGIQLKGEERLCWAGIDDVRRATTIPAFAFNRKISL